MNKKKIILIGCTPNNLNYISTLHRLNYKISAIVDDRILKIAPNSKYKIIDYQALTPRFQDHDFFIAIGDNFLRRNYINKIKKIFPYANFPTIIDPLSDVVDPSKIGQGTIIGPFCYIGTNCRINEFNIISSHSSLNHDNSLGSYNYLGTQTILNGGAIIDSYISIFSQSVISRNVKVDFCSSIGAKSFVNTNVGKNSLFYGTPAKFIRKLKKNESLVTSS